MFIVGGGGGARPPAPRSHRASRGMRGARGSGFYVSKSFSNPALLERILLHKPPQKKVSRERSCQRLGGAKNLSKPCPGAPSPARPPRVSVALFVVSPVSSKAYVPLSPSGSSVLVLRPADADK